MGNRYRIAVACVLLVCLASFATTASATSMRQSSIVDMLEKAEEIVVGKVVSMTDGFDNDGFPYTEITLELDEELVNGRSDSGTYTFRQFGLMAPRQMPDGRTNLNVTPEGFPTFAMGEKVVAFIYKAARVTGFQTTVGLFQGKFTVEDGQVFNAVSNQGLFNDVSVRGDRLDEQQQKMLQMPQGSVSEDVFLPFLRAAVSERWVDEGVLFDAQ